MKKILMTLATAFVAVSMSAQNNMYVGGSLGYTKTAFDGDELNHTLRIMPEFGVQLNEQWGVGVEFGYDATTEKGTPDLTSSTFTFAPYARYTALKFGPVNVFADGQFSYDMTNNETVGLGGNAEDNKENAWKIAIKPGIAYNITDNLSLVAKLGDVIGYRSSKPDADGAKATTTFSFLDLSNAITFGIFYNF
jgi:hypothetical protein